MLSLSHYFVLLSLFCAPNFVPNFSLKSLKLTRRWCGWIHFVRLSRPLPSSQASFSNEINKYMYIMLSELHLGTCVLAFLMLLSNDEHASDHVEIKAYISQLLQQTRRHPLISTIWWEAGDKKVTMMIKWTYCMTAVMKMTQWWM